MWDQQLVADATREADEDRTKRAFIGFLSSALGVDQTPVGQDGYMGRSTDQFSLANPDGSQSLLGRSVSNVQAGFGPAGLVISPGLLLLAGVAFFLLKR